MRRVLNIDREIAQRGIPTSAHNTYRKALAGNRPAAVKAMCLECQGYEDGARQAIRDCPSVGCPLHAVRPFQPKRAPVTNHAIRSGVDLLPQIQQGRQTISPGAADHLGANLENVESKILDHLHRHGESARGYIIFSTGIPESLWTEAIRSLLAKGEIEKSGEKRSTRYRLKED